MGRKRSPEKLAKRGQRPAYLNGIQKQQLDAQASKLAAEREALRKEVAQWEVLKTTVMRQSAALRKHAKMLNEQRLELEQACAHTFVPATHR